MRYYVYALIDPRTGSPFYIGKGKRDRIKGHEAEARKGAHSAKCHRIRDIWESGHQVRREYLSYHECENEALQAEADEIDRIGLDNLTNVLPGGIMGVEAYLRISEEREARRKLRLKHSFGDALDDMAPKFARAFRLMQETGGIGFQIDERWHDLSKPVMAIFREIVETVGFDRVAEVMRRHGVEIAR